MMAKHVIHISELEGATHFAALLAGLSAGEEIVIEDDSRTVAVVHPAEPLLRTISECIALAKAHEEETGEAPVLDPDFAEDMGKIIQHRQAWNLAVPVGRTISECLALLPENSTATIDADFAKDVQAAIANHREALDSSAWE